MKKEKIDAIDALLKEKEDGMFFRKRNFLAHSKEKQLVMMIMRIPKNCLFHEECKISPI